MLKLTAIKIIGGMVSLGLGSGLFWQGVMDMTNPAKTTILLGIGTLLIVIGSWLIMDMRFSLPPSKSVTDLDNDVDKNHN